MSIYSWIEVGSALASEANGTRIRLAKHLVEHPIDGGLRLGIGLPVGQRSDFRLKLPDCRGLHVQDFGSHYEAHIDQTDPGCDALLHLMRDAPGTFVVSSALVGGLLGLLLGKSGEAFTAGLLVGAGIGGLSAAAAARNETTKTGPLPELTDANNG